MILKELQSSHFKFFNVNLMADVFKQSPNMEEKVFPNVVTYCLVGTELKQFFFILRVVHSHNFVLTQQINNRTAIYLFKVINETPEKGLKQVQS